MNFDLLKSEIKMKDFYLNFEKGIMDYFTSFLEFFGAWFLFGAPLFQSVTELYEELDKREKLIREIYSHNFEEHVKSISFWWWLFPPLKILLEKIEIKRKKNNR